MPRRRKKPENLPTAFQLETLERRILFSADAALPDLATLLDDLAHSGYADKQVVVLDAETDALTQISKILAEKRGVTALHVMSHGSRGVLELAGQRIETLDLLSRADELAQWRVALAPGADVLLYGCEVAAVSAH